MPPSIRSAAVLGAGTMGSQLAAHLANAGLPVLLFDRSIDLVRTGIDRLRTLRPDPWFAPGLNRLITPGTFDTLESLGQVDWILEAIVEQKDAKRELLGQVERVAAAEAVISTNTSGLSVTGLAEGRPGTFHRRWLGTHFFNPPRYMRLVEIVPTPGTDPAVEGSLSAFLDHRLGKGVVRAKDTPGFIANRLGIFGLVRILNELATGAFTVEEIDALTGPLIGRPKSATLRTVDLAGLDILAAVADDLAARLPDEASAFRLPLFVRQMIERGWLGAKSGQGFYAREGGDPQGAILSLDPAALAYRPRREARLPGLDAAERTPVTGERLRSLFLSPDRAGQFLRRTVGATLVYAATVAPDIADSIDDVDRAMRLGFGWELGPFETWDAIGLRAVLDACEIADAPPIVREAIDAGRDRVGDGRLPPAEPGLLLLQTAKRRTAPLRENAAATILDLGDGVLGVDLHSKMNVIGGDTIEIVVEAVAMAESGFAGLVIGSEAEHFSAGANLLLLLLEAQEEHWDEIDLMVRSFQRMTMAIKTSGAPVVVAPAGMALGGGCEICLHAARVQAAAETYLGLVEVGVGLIPAGGGTKEMLWRATAGARDPADARRAVQAAFETIGYGRVSASAADARRLGYLRDADGVTMNRERVIARAKGDVLALVDAGYRPVRRQPAVPVGGASAYAALSVGVHLAHQSGHITDHDALIGRKLAWVLSGGDLPHASSVSEDYLLDLEREAFLSLCGEEKTLERIGYTLRTGKTLRN
jgi:3-hydroxyacyl-CoA dehydrogenase